MNKSPTDHSYLFPVETPYFFFPLFIDWQLFFPLPSGVPKVLVWVRIGKTDPKVFIWNAEILEHQNP
jgi:hypothetical protein